jgi:hypothetical protein
MSGLVADKELASIGHEKGADIVIQLILCRIPDNSKVKFILTAVYVEGNILATSNIVVSAIPSGYDIKALPLQSEDSTAVVKKMTNKIVNKQISGIYDEPVRPPKKTINLPKKELPKIDLSVLSDDAWWGVGVFSNFYYSNDTWLFGLSPKLEYGRNGDNWNVLDRLCFELSPVYFYSESYWESQNGNSNSRNSNKINVWGFDINVGYRLWNDIFSLWSYETERVIGASVIASAGFAITPKADKPFIPYLQIKLHHIIYPLPSIAMRFSLTPPMFGISLGYSFQMEF